MISWPVILIVIAVAVIAIFVGIRYRMTGRMALMLIGLAVLFGGIFGWKMYSGYAMYMAMQSNVPHSTVSAIKAESQDWQPKLGAVGSLRAARGVDISNELSGMVDDIRFNSGGDVKEGDLLIKLKADDDIARLNALKATAHLAEITYARDKKQFAAQAVAQATLDNDAAQLANARAQADQQLAIVEKKYIRAPFSGHLGIRNVDVGQYLNPGTAIVTLQQLDPIFLDFYLPQQSLSQVRVGQSVHVKCDAFPGRAFEGQITAINAKVETSTRNVLIRSQIDNSDHALLPGMFANADVSAGDKVRTITLPQTAITYNPYGNTVFVLQEKGAGEKKGEKSKDEKDKPQLEAQQTFVTIGETRGDQVQVLKGVNEGDLVVTSGQIKLQNGSLVTVDNSLAPKNDANPEPKDE